MCDDPDPQINVSSFLCDPQGGARDLISELCVDLAQQACGGGSVSE